MKAAVRLKYGPPEVLQIKEIDKPTPADNELLVKVYAATVNRTDCGILWGKPYIIRLFSGFPNPSSPVTGTDFAGIIEAVGKNASNFKAGDRVWGFNDNGLSSHAQYMTIAHDSPAALIPDGISYEQAASSPEGAHYAYNFIKKVKVEKGQQVLVNGASGAIGSAAVQFLKHYGLKVTAVCNTKNIELVRTLGADRIIDFTTEDFTTDNERYHFVFDAVGKSTYGRCKPLLLPGGVYISSELGPGSENLYLALFTPLSGDKKLKFPFPTDIRGSIRFIRDLLEKGAFKPVIDRRYPLDKIDEAFHYVAPGQKTGNVVIKPWGDET